MQTILANDITVAKTSNTDGVPVFVLANHGCDRSERKSLGP